MPGLKQTPGTSRRHDIFPGAHVLVHCLWDLEVRITSKIDWGGCLTMYPFLVTATAWSSCSFHLLLQVLVPPQSLECRRSGVYGGLWSHWVSSACCCLDLPYHWYGLSLTYILNNLGIKLPAKNKHQVYKVVREINTWASIGGVMVHVVYYWGCIQ